MSLFTKKSQTLLLMHLATDNVSGIEALQEHKTEIHCLQDLHPKPVARKAGSAAAGSVASAPQEAPARRASSRETDS